MRRGQDPKLLRGDDGRVIAVSLGADFCAEHEWGIDGIRRAFGLNDAEEAVGLDKRQTTEVPAKFAWCGDGFIFGFWNKPSLDNGELRRRRDEPLVAAWSERDFAVRGFDASSIAALREVYDALASKQAAIWLGGGGLFENAGLVLAVAGRLPVSVLQAWTEADEERLSVKREAAVTGIEERLKKAGRRWYALHPKRLKGVLHFWLNPMEQDRYEAGWFTVAELDQWAKGTGPVMKRSEVRP